jgi:hypothetical protein
MSPGRHDNEELHYTRRGPVEFLCLCVMRFDDISQRLDSISLLSIVSFSTDNLDLLGYYGLQASNLRHFLRLLNVDFLDLLDREEASLQFR